MCSRVGMCGCVCVRESFDFHVLFCFVFLTWKGWGRGREEREGESLR